MISIVTRQRRGRVAPRSTTNVFLRIAVGTLFLGLLGFSAFEGYRAYAFYSDLQMVRTSLLELRDDLSLESLEDSEESVLRNKAMLDRALIRAESARRFAEGDPLLGLAKHVPFLDKQAEGLSALVRAAELSTRTGMLASEVALAFARQTDDPDLTSIQEAMAFLESQSQPMEEVTASLTALKAEHSALPDGLIGPLGAAKAQLGEALTKLDSLVTGYERAHSFLPSLLGYDGQRTYLVLPQNDTELFPSGGLISSYGIATFTDGELGEMEFEYFETLFERWQQESDGEYIEPPVPLANYLKQGYSWGLGEAGWYPDFPTTSEIAANFVKKGGAPTMDGTIAIDTYFIRALLDQLGALELPDYGVTVDAENFQEVALELTRDEWDVPLEEKKAFLSDLSEALLKRIFATPREDWVPLLEVLDRMAQQRHLQIHLSDPDMQSLAVAYGLDGSIERPETGDYLLLVDTSVNSTKLNMILETGIDVDIALSEQGTVAKTVSYHVENPFPEWAKGRDPELVERLMFDGLYGSYLRVYAMRGSALKDVRFGGQTIGAEAIESEFGYTTFGRYFPVLPGTSAGLDVVYETPGVVQADGSLRTYRLYVQKQAGTGAVPLALNFSLPDGARLESVLLDGKAWEDGLSLRTDLLTDRTVVVVYRLR